MKKATSRQIGYIIGLGKGHGLEYSSNDFKDEKGNINVSYQEAHALIVKLQGNQDPSDLMRKKIISMAKTMRWLVEGTEKADMARIDAWCIKYGKFHKALNNHSHKELTELVSQFQNGLLRSYLKKKAITD